jgi:hypothetical protein
MKTYLSQFLVTSFLFVLISLTSGCSSSQWSRDRRYEPDRFVQRASLMYGVGQSEAGMPRGQNNYEHYRSNGRVEFREVIRRGDYATLYVNAYTGEKALVLERDQSRWASTNNLSQWRFQSYYDDPKGPHYSYVEGPKGPLLPPILKRGRK